LRTSVSGSVPAFGDFLVGSLPAATGRKMHFTGTTVLKVVNGKCSNSTPVAEPSER
jgi:hypothetical protein